METASLPGVLRRWRIAFLAPLALCAAFSLLVRPEPASLAAPILGPWAGIAYGHHECTLASLLPGWSIAACVVGALGMAAWASSRTRTARLLLAVLLVTWAIAWSAFAALSVVNTTS